MRFKMRPKPEQPEKRLNLEILKDDNIAAEFQVRIGGRFKALLNENTNQEERWNIGRYMLLEEATEILGHRRNRKQRWTTEEILDKCDKRREAERVKNVNPTEENRRTHKLVGKRGEENV